MLSFSAIKVNQVQCFLEIHFKFELQEQKRTQQLIELKKTPQGTIYVNINDRKKRKNS